MQGVLIVRFTIISNRSRTFDTHRNLECIVLSSCKKKGRKKKKEEEGNAMKKKKKQQKKNTKIYS